MNKEQSFSIGDFSAMTGISIRTLHYYDDLGLLKPDRDPSSGHRLYTNKDLIKLQKIVSLKFLGYRLEQIIEMMEESKFDLSLKESLQMQQKAFEAKKEQLETAIKAVKRTIVLLEEEGEVESSVLMSLIRNIQTEKEQRLWFEQHASKEIANQLYDKSEKEMIALDKEYISLTKEVKRLAGKPFDAPEVHAMIESFIKCSMDFLGEKGMLSFKEIPPERVDELQQLFPSPFTDAEESWLNEAMKHYEKYMEEKGMIEPNQQSQEKQ